MICLRKYKLHYLGVVTDINIYDVLMFDYLYRVFKDVKIHNDNNVIYCGYEKCETSFCSIVENLLILYDNTIYENLMDYMFKKLKCVEDATISDMTSEIKQALIEFIDDELNVKIERIELY